MEHFGIIGGAGAVAGIAVGVANYGFDQTWGAAHFFVLWAIFLVITYGGILILDDGLDW